MENKIIISIVIGIILVLVMPRLNMWLVPKLQKIHFEKRLELQRLKDIHESQKRAKDLHTKKEDKAKDDKHNK